MEKLKFVLGEVWMILMILFSIIVHNRTYTSVTLDVYYYHPYFLSRLRNLCQTVKEFFKLYLNGILSR